MLDDLNFLGFLFESLAVRDLRVYAQAADAEVFHYHDENGLEVDAIVEDVLGRWIAYEVKLGAGLVDDGVKSLLKLAKKVTDKTRGKLAALVVITVGQYALQRDDGVWMIPITALGP